ncbi:MAG: gamma-glutamyltransferase [Vicinamibacteria bacterium]
MRLLLHAATAVLIAVLVAPLAPPAPVAAQAPSGAPLPIPGRSMVTTKYGIVAASSPLAAQAGVRILERGGHAVDAAIAANAVLNVVEPAMNGIGGDLFAIVYDAKADRLQGINASGWSPSGLTAEMLKAKGLTRVGRDIYSVTVPGAVAGWHALRERYGRQSMADILAPAIHYAEAGFPVGEVAAGQFASALKLLSQHPEARDTYLLDGARAPKEGDTFRNPALAGSLRRIAAEGRDGFYTGPTAEAILALSRELGGTMTAADLAEYQIEWVEPIESTYRGWTVSELPPNGSGIAALMMLNIMERYPLRDWGFHSPQALHVMIEAKKLAYADMIRYVGEPQGAKIPIDTLLSDAHAARRAALIDPKKAACEVPAATLDGVTNNPEGNDTIYLTVIDRDGNIVSLIQSIYSGFGTGLVPEGTGFALHNRGQLFSLEPDHVNTLAPRKRPVHTIIPAFLRKDDIRIGFGIMGGWNQSQAHAQFVANIVDYDMTIQQALEAGRFTKGSFNGCDVSIEALIPEPSRDALTALGHEIRVVQPRSGTFGWGQAVMRRGDGTHFGASEPRHDGAAIPEGPPVP